METVLAYDSCAFEPLSLWLRQQYIAGCEEAYCLLAWYLVCPNPRTCPPPPALLLSGVQICVRLSHKVNETFAGISPQLALLPAKTWLCSVFTVNVKKWRAFYSTAFLARKIVLPGHSRPHNCYSWSFSPFITFLSTPLFPHPFYSDRIAFRRGRRPS